MEQILTREEVADLVKSWFEDNLETGLNVTGGMIFPEDELLRTALMDILNVSVP